MWWTVMSLKTQLHTEPYQAKNGFGTISEYIELHTYDDGEHVWAYIHGGNSDDVNQTVNMLWNEAEVRAIRDALNQYLGET